MGSQAEERGAAMEQRSRVGLGEQHGTCRHLNVPKPRTGRPRSGLKGQKEEVGQNRLAESF